VDFAGFKIGDVEIAPGGEMFVIAGPCVIEDANLCLDIAYQLKAIAQTTGIGMIFKASFDKANRSSVESFRGPGLEKGLEILDMIRSKTGLAILTDVHEPYQAQHAGEVVDCLQIPAFLCRQTDLLVAAAQTGKPVNVKKGQFLSPWEMENVVEKLRFAGCSKILLTERGTFFGYNRLVNDFGGIGIMKQLGCPVVFDATHSTQQPGGLGTASAGVRSLGPVLARAAIASGADARFMEVHPDPNTAKCDAACMMPLAWVQDVVETCKQIRSIVKDKHYDYE